MMSFSLPIVPRDISRSAFMIAAAVGLLTTAPVAATETITVEGNRRVDAEMVSAQFHPLPDGRYDAAALDAALKALLATGLFEDVVIRRAGGGIVVRVVEAKVLGRVAFEGNRKIKDADLTKIIQAKPQAGLQRATVQADVERIRESYRRIGRSDVTVVPELIARGNDRVDLIYTITEGARTPIRRIDFAGNHAFSARQLKAVINTSETTMVSFLTGGGVYDPDRVEGDRELLRQYYRNHGYADATVSKVGLSTDPAAKATDLSFVIDEGNLYRFGDISVVSDVPGVDVGRLQGTLLARRDATFDGRLLDRTVDALARELNRQGQSFTQATPRLARDAAAHRIDVAFVIASGPRSYVERIDIHGNARTRDEVIRREFDIAEGDATNRMLIERAERRLRGLNYFKTVKITTRPGSSADRVVLDVEAIDQPTGNFNVSGGYSTTDGVLAEVKVGDRNVAGTGNAIQAAVTYGQFARGANLSLARPGVFDTRATAGIELFGREAIVSPYQSFGSTSYGGTLSLATPVTEQTSILWRTQLYDQKVTLSPAATNATASLPVRQAAAAGAQLVSSVGDTVTYDTLDDRKAPTNGLKSQLSQDLAGLGGDVRFLRTTQDTRYYHALGNDLVAMVRAQGGHITGWGGQQVPLLNNFFGGPSMVRGFAQNGFGPRDLTPGSTMDNVGGSLYWATTAELQSAIPGVPNEYGLRASAFVDAGSVLRPNVPQGSQIARRNAVRSSVGAGLTWASPFGALTVDYAVPLSKAGYDVVQPLRFSAGGF